MREQGPGSPSGAGAPSPDAGTVPARGRAWGMQGRADPAPGVRGPVLVPAPPEQGLGRGRHGRPPCTLTHRRNEPIGKGACTRRGLGPARRQDQRPVAFPGRPISGRGRSASGEDAPTPLHYCVLPSPAHLARLLLPSKALAAAPGTAPSAPQSRDGPRPRGDAACTPTSPAAGAGDPTVGEALTPLPGTERVTDLRTGVREASRGDSPRLTFETRVLRGGGRIVGEPQAGATVCPERRRWGFTPAWSAYAHQAAGLG